MSKYTGIVLNAALCQIKHKWMQRISTGKCILNRQFIYVLQYMSLQQLPAPASESTQIFWVFFHNLTTYFQGAPSLQYLTTRTLHKTDVYSYHEQHILDPWRWPRPDHTQLVQRGFHIVLVSPSLSVLPSLQWVHFSFPRIPVPKPVRGLCGPVRGQGSSGMKSAAISRWTPTEFRPTLPIVSISYP